MNIKGVIIRVTPYRETSAMLNVLTSDGIISFLIKGAFKNKNFNTLITSPMLFADFTFVNNDKKHLIFKEATPIIDSKKFMNNFNKLFAINLINEILIHLFNDIEMTSIYDYLIEIIKCIDKNDDVLPFILVFLANALINLGYGLNVNNCIKCSSKENIVGISYIDGGFLCGSCFDKNKDITYSANQIKILHYIFNIKLENIKDIKFNNKDAKVVLKDLLIYTYNQTGYRFKNIKLIDKIR